MDERSASIKLLRELSDLLNSFPGLTTEEIGGALKSSLHGTLPESRPPDGKSGAAKIMAACAKAFGNRQEFASKEDACRIARLELGIQVPEAIPWNHLRGAVAFRLLELPDGAEKAEALVRKYRFKVAAGGRVEKGGNSTLEMMEGIIQAKST